MTTKKKGLIDFARDALNEDSQVMLTEFTGMGDANVLYLYFCDKGYDVSIEECVKAIQGKEKFIELNPRPTGTPPVTY